MSDSLYILRSEKFPDILKIGYTSVGAETRAKQLRGSYGDEFKVAFEVDVTNGPECERLVHKRLSDYRVGKLELFKVDLDLAKDVLFSASNQTIELNQRRYLKLPDYIDIKHHGNKAAFARAIGTTPQHVTKMINRGDVMIDGEMYGKRGIADKSSQ